MAERDEDTTGQSPEPGFDPVGLAEIAEMTGESKQNLNYLMGTPGAPRPAELARGKVWRRSEVAAWWVSIGREVNWTDTPPR